MSDHTPSDITKMVNRPAAPDEPPLRAITTIGRLIDEAVDEAMQEHVRLHHAADMVVTVDELLDRLQSENRDQSSLKSV